jgi:RNA polymerase sigma factor (sigma-70 family)
VSLHRDRSPGDSGRSESAGRPLILAAERSLRDRLAARDEQALVELIDLATPWLLGITQAMLRDPDEAEECVHDAFVILWNRVDLLDDETGRLMPFLLRVARNRAIDRLRVRARHRRKALRLEGSGELDTAAVPAEPNEAAHPGWHVHQSVHRALEALPEHQREVVRLAYFQGLTMAEIADRVGIPLGTVKTRLHRAINRLRISLASIKDWLP